MLLEESQMKTSKSINLNPFLAFFAKLFPSSIEGNLLCIDTPCGEIGYELSQDDLDSTYFDIVSKNQGRHYTKIDLKVLEEWIFILAITVKPTSSLYFDRKMIRELIDHLKDEV